MGHREKVLEKIITIGQRSNERQTLWQSVVDSFEEEGADGVATNLASQIANIQNDFETLLSKLNGML